MTWRKSSFSDPDNCVEIRSDLHAIRDTKHPQVILSVGDSTFGRLVKFVQAERGSGLLP
nr:DUF397 domain-containing protein [Actinophytocola oryzae]